MISTQPFITGALSGFKTLFKTCSEQVSKCYKLFPSFHAWTMFPPLIIFQSYSKNSQKHWQVETWDLYEKSCRGKSTDCGRGSPQWDSPHSKLLESERKASFEEIFNAMLRDTALSWVGMHWEIHPPRTKRFHLGGDCICVKLQNVIFSFMFLFTQLYSEL